jgi:predicted outer membrane protein
MQTPRVLPVTGAALLALACLAATACGAPPPQGEEASSAPSGLLVTNAAAPEDAGHLDDDEIVGVINAANANAIREGSLAQSSGTGSSEAVQSLAAEVVVDHTNASGALTTLEQQTSLSPQASAVQAQLDSNARSTIASLSGLSGSAFDDAYVRSQLAMDTTLLSLLNDSLLPEAESEELATLARNTRGMIELHLQLAQGLLAAELEDAGTAAAQ